MTICPHGDSTSECCRCASGDACMHGTPRWAYCRQCADEERLAVAALSRPGGGASLGCATDRPLPAAVGREAQFVAGEVVRAMEMHAGMSSRHEAYAVILEELDEFWDEVKLNPSKMSPPDRCKWEARMKKELRQVAAMAIRAIVDLKL